jgi:alpha-ketoglutarate-dependent taurine dioxygenase
MWYHFFMTSRNIDTYRNLSNELIEEVSEHGWTTREIGIDPSNLDEARHLVGALATLLSHKMTREPEISDIHVAAPGEKKYLAMSNAEMDFHSDNVYLENPCANVLLYCLHQAEEGGETLLVDARKVVDDIDPSVAIELAEPKWRWNNHFTNGGGICPPRPAVDIDGAIRWSRTSLRNTNSTDLMIADKFNSALHDPSVIESVTLKPGELISIDNTRVLHSRTEFKGNKRHLIRGRAW